MSHHEGDRSTDDAIALFHDIEKRRSISSPVLVFTSDDRDAFEEGIVNVYGSIEQPPYKGIGRKPLSRLVPYLDLKYAQVCKKREKGRIVEVVQRVVFGEPECVLRLLGADPGGKIKTSYAERLNLTFRNALSRFIRKGMNYSKNRHMHSKAIDFLHARYNFIKPHKSLRAQINQENRRWMQRTPALAEGITDHIWTFKELLTFRVPIQ